MEIALPEAVGYIAPYAQPVVNAAAGYVGNYLRNYVAERTPEVSNFVKRAIKRRWNNLAAEDTEGAYERKMAYAKKRKIQTKGFNTTKKTKYGYGIPNLRKKWRRKKTMKMRGTEYRPQT